MSTMARSGFPICRDSSGMASDTPTIMPTDVRELALMVRSAGAERRTLAVRAGGSKICMLPIATDAVLDVSKLSGLIDYQPTELVLTARAGTPLADIVQLLAN